MGFDIAETRNGAPADGISRVSCIDEAMLLEDVNYLEELSIKLLLIILL